MKKLSIFFIFFVIASGCVKQIELSSIVVNESVLVVDALLTDELKHQVIKLSKSIALDSTNIIKESNAQIKITEDNSNIYNFSEKEKGVYLSDKIFKAKKGSKYTLEIVTSDGSKYISTEEEIYGYNVIDQIEIKKEKNKFDEEVLSIYVKSDGSNNENAQYYRYRYEENYKIIAPFWRDEMFDMTKLPELVIVPNTEFSKICYGLNESSEIILKESTFADKKNTEFLIFNLKEDDFKISHRYSVLIKQYVQSPEAFSFSNKVLRNSTSQSLFVQSQPGAITGNIISDKRVFGYFEVSSVSTKRIFFNHSDFFDYNPQNFIYPETCGDLYIPFIKARKDGGGLRYPLREAVESGDWLYYGQNGLDLDQDINPYRLVRKDCGDCTKYGSKIKPSFWID